MDPWKHRSQGMRCRTCLWFVEKQKIEGTAGMQTTSPSIQERGSLGRCRRHSPTMNGYPGIFQSDWCGDHKLDENKI